MKPLTKRRLKVKDPEKSDSEDYSPERKFDSNMEDSQVGSLM